MIYKILQNSVGDKTGVLRMEDNAGIPFDPDNTDYQAYLKWLDEGNTPLLAEE